MKFLIFTLACVGAFVGLMLNLSDPTVPQGLLLVGLAIVAAWGSFTLIGSAASHLDDLQRVHQAKANIVSAEQRLTEVKDLAADKTGLPEQLLALQQDDNPVTKYMLLVAKAIENVEHEQNALARAKAAIAARKAGPLNIVVTWFGDEPLA